MIIICPIHMFLDIGNMHKPGNPRGITWSTEYLIRFALGLAIFCFLFRRFMYKRRMPSKTPTPNPPEETYDDIEQSMFEPPDISPVIQPAEAPVVKSLHPPRAPMQTSTRLSPFIL